MTKSSHTSGEIRHRVGHQGPHHHTEAGRVTDRRQGQTSCGQGHMEAGVLGHGLWFLL